MTVHLEDPLDGEVCLVGRQAVGVDKSVRDIGDLDDDQWAGDGGQSGDEVDVLHQSN